MKNWTAVLTRRPSLMAGIGAALACGILAMFRAPPSTALLLGWCGGVLAYLAVALRLGFSLSPEQTRHRAADMDEGQDVVLAGSIVATIICLAAVGLDLAGARNSPSAGFSAALGVVTVALSWIFVHVLFAHRYMHEDALRGGLEFPGNDKPDFGEFLYVAFTVGMTAQISDTTTSTAAMRRLVLAHALVSFVFNAAIVAAAVNVAAGLVN